MTLFSSPRERRLWCWAFFVIATIYLTLGFAQSLAGFLRTEGLLEIAFGVGAILVFAAIGAHGLRTRADGGQIFIALGVIAVYLFVLIRIMTPEERTHIIEYSVVALLVLEALRERKANWPRTPSPSFLAIAATIFFGVVDELIQYALPNRVFDTRDILFNALAAIMAVSASNLLAIGRNRK